MYLSSGAGYSTAVMADAMHILSSHFQDWMSDNSRVEKPFHVYSVDESLDFSEVSRSRIRQHAQYITFTHSDVELINHDNRIATVYSCVPNIIPDLIYLDGPGQYATSQHLNGISFNSRSRMPISADVLRLEFFLEPGTLILVDGRTNNARFLRAYLKRAWEYRHDIEADVHFFELQEDPLGFLNRKKIQFCLDNQ